jgi:DNA-binding Xre family transcriptional regulator
MDPVQREAFRDQVIVAMAHKGWNATKTAKEAGVSENTMTRVTRAQNVAVGTISKIRIALGIEALADAQADAGYPQDVEWVRDVVGMWLRDFMPAVREKKIDKLMKLIIKDKQSGLDSDHS